MKHTGSLESKKDACEFFWATPSPAEFSMGI